MLKQLLDEIAKGNALDIDSLAARLNTTPKMVYAMLEHLERTGTLEQYQSCDGGCTGCNLSPQCGSNKKESRVWEYEIPAKT